MWVQYSGMKKLEKSVLPASYKTLWIAGKSSELISEIKPVKDIIDRLKQETAQAIEETGKLLKAGN